MYYEFCRCVIQTTKFSKKHCINFIFINFISVDFVFLSRVEGSVKAFGFILSPFLRGHATHALCRTQWDFIQFINNISPSNNTQASICLAIVYTYIYVVWMCGLATAKSPAISVVVVAGAHISKYGKLNYIYFSFLHHHRQNLFL